MIRVAISVEGYTEDEFTKLILVPYFRTKDIELTSVVVTTKRIKSGLKYKGGSINVKRIKNEVEKLLPNFDYVTTFYDYYGFQNKGSLSVELLEKKIFNLFNNKKFIPYVQKYEFETLLFSDPNYYCEHFDTIRAQKDIEKIIKCFSNIEEINNSKDTSPAKRITDLFNNYNENYDKFVDGPMIIKEIGLNKVMNRCNRFNKWIKTISNLSNI